MNICRSPVSVFLCYLYWKFNLLVTKYYEHIEKNKIVLFFKIIKIIYLKLKQVFIVSILMFEIIFITIKKYNKQTLYFEYIAKRLN